MRKLRHYVYCGPGLTIINLRENLVLAITSYKQISPHLIRNSRCIYLRRLDFVACNTLLGAIWYKCSIPYQHLITSPVEAKLS